MSYNNCKTFSKDEIEKSSSSEGQTSFSLAGKIKSKKDMRLTKLSIKTLSQKKEPDLTGSVLLYDSAIEIAFPSINVLNTQKRLLNAILLKFN